MKKIGVVLAYIAAVPVAFFVGAKMHIPGYYLVSLLPESWMLALEKLFVF
jgi:hypothetical protein